MQFWYDDIWAEESGGNPFSETFTIDLPATAVLATTSLQSVKQQGSNGQATIAITQYVQNGDPHEGNWQNVNGNGVTSVTFTLTVVNAYAQGLGLILAIDE